MASTLANGVAILTFEHSLPQHMWFLYNAATALHNCVLNVSSHIARCVHVFCCYWEFKPGKVLVRNWLSTNDQQVLKDMAKPQYTLFVATWPPNCRSWKDVNDLIRPIAPSVSQTWQTQDSPPYPWRTIVKGEKEARTLYDALARRQFVVHLWDTTDEALFLKSNCSPAKCPMCRTIRAHNAPVSKAYTPVDSDAAKSPGKHVTASRRMSMSQSSVRSSTSGSTDGQSVAGQTNAYVRGSNGLPINVASGTRLVQNSIIFVRNLDFHVSDDKLYGHLSKVQGLTKCRIDRKSSGESRGTAKAEYANSNAAQEAVTRFNGKRIRDRRIEVKLDQSAAAIRIESSTAERVGRDRPPGPLVVDGSTQHLQRRS